MVVCLPDLALLGRVHTLVGLALEHLCEFLHVRQCSDDTELRRRMRILLHLQQVSLVCGA